MQRFRYDRERERVGIVHFGIGAFHRAHEAWYTDKALDAGDRDWLITGVSLRSRDVATQMNPQDGLYTVCESSGDGRGMRIVGAVRNVVPATWNRSRVELLLAAENTRIASFTITEKGYCKAPDGSLDLELAGAGSIFPFVTNGLRRRRDAGRGGITLLSCDNLSDNGRQLARLMAEYLDRFDPGLRGWFERECTCPSTMVDRIVPATTNADRLQIGRAIGLEDDAAVITEPFSQWVIEDCFAAGRPVWDKVGAELVDDVRPYEAAKLRMLNGAHSALAYLGLERGHAFVHQAIVDPFIRETVERLMRREAAPTVVSADGQNLDAYATLLLKRFENSALDHRLEQIAMDGSQKIPQRWLETLMARDRAGNDSPAIMTALAAWLRHVRGDARCVDDPLAEPLAAEWRRNGAAGIVAAIFGQEGILAGNWMPSAAQIAELSGRL